MRLRQFAKFCLVGASGVVVDMAVLHLLARGLGWNVRLSKVCSAETAMLNNFFWNEVWTFRSSTAGSRRGDAAESGSLSIEKHPPPYVGGDEAGARRRPTDVAARLFSFHAICGVGIGLAVFFLHLFYGWLGFNLYAANLLAILLVTLWNFWLNARFNWGGPQPS